MDPATSIDFFCAFCGSELAVPPELQGSVVECAACSRSIPVPGRLNREAPVSECLPLFNADILSVEMTFVCPGCEGSLVADARYEGAPFVCPKCNFGGSVPTWSGFIAPEPGLEARLPAVVLTSEEIDFLSGERADATPLAATPR